MIPAIIIKGIIPVAISAIFHSKINAIIIPLIKLDIFWKITVTNVVVRPLTKWQPFESLAFKLPALFFGKSNQYTGIFRIFA
jgi:hypothetical protein